MFHFPLKVTQNTSADGFGNQPMPHHFSEPSVKNSFRSAKHIQPACLIQVF
jgi:hypothetical protein